MKRRILALLLAVLTLTMLTAAVFAEDATANGAYNLKSLDKRYTLTAADGNNDGSGFYANASTFTLECKKLTGNYSLVLLLDETNGVTGIPTVSNLQYIDQVDIKEGEARFSIIPKAMTNGATYNVYVSTNDENGALAKVASFQYGTKPPFELGKVNNDDVIDSRDALLVLQHAAKMEGYELTGSALLAADVNQDGTADSRDALLILQYAAKMIDEF